MKSAIRRKFNRHTAAFDWHRTMAAKTFAEFDDAVTAPLHGFTGKDEYYDRCSSDRFLEDISISTLVINALDDPFMTPGAIPKSARLPSCLQIEVAAFGGHIGFINGGYPWRPSYYLPDRIVNFLDDRIAAAAGHGRSLPGP